MRDRRLVWPAASAVVVGVALRLLVAARGHNFDLDSSRIVGAIVAHNGSMYAMTTRFNYGPPWAWVLGGLWRLTIGAGFGFGAFRYAITAVLTGTDLLLAGLLGARFGRRVATLFFLNPVSIVISGYHGQFDNVAILLSLMAIVALEDEATEIGVGPLALLGVGLAVKHVFALFPLWIALRRRGTRPRLAALAIPYGVFAVSFLPYWRSWHGIIRNVVEYRSAANAPLLASVMGHVPPWPVAIGVFVVAAVVGALVTRDRSLAEAALVYLLIMVAFAPAMANQYLAIAAPAAVVLLNPAFGAFFAVAALFLVADKSGLHYLGGVSEPAAYGLLAVLLVLGLGVDARRRRGAWGAAAQASSLERS